MPKTDKAYTTMITDIDYVKINRRLYFLKMKVSTLGTVAQFPQINATFCFI